MSARTRAGRGWWAWLLHALVAEVIGHRQAGGDVARCSGCARTGVVLVTGVPRWWRPGRVYRAWCGVCLPVRPGRDDVLVWWLPAPHTGTWQVLDRLLDEVQVDCVGCEGWRGPVTHVVWAHERALLGETYCTACAGEHQAVGRFAPDQLWVVVGPLYGPLSADCAAIAGAYPYRRPVTSAPAELTPAVTTAVQAAATYVIESIGGDQ